MSDPTRPRDLLPHPAPPVSLHISTSTPPSMAAPPPPPPQHPATFHYPHVYVDPVSAAATAAAFYRQHRRQQQPPPSQLLLEQQQPTEQQEQHRQQQAQQSATVRQHQVHQQQQPPQSQPLPLAQQQLQHSQQPYYLHDPVAATAVAQMQMQLQMQLQLQAQHQPQTQTQRPPAPRQQQVPKHVHPATSEAVKMIVQPPLTAVPTVAAHLPPMLAGSNQIPGMGDSSMAMPARLQPLPVVPESQMASAYRIGRYTPAERRIRLERYREKRAQRNYNRRVKYDCRKMIADKRRRVQGRFVKREEEIALAAQQIAAASGDHGKMETGEDGTEDGTEDETKVHQPESSGSGSSGQPLESVTVSGRGMGVEGDVAGAQQESFIEQSDQVL